MSEQEWMEELLNTKHEEAKFSEKQIKIIQAAIESFSEKGYAATSTNEIATKAGVAEGTIFRHYKTKKELLMSILMPTLSKIVAPFFMKNFVKDVFDNKFQSYEEFIRTLIINRFEFAKKHLPIVKIFLQEFAFHSEIKQIQKVFTEHVYHKFVDIVEHFQEKGDIISCPPRTVIQLTITTIIGHMITRFLILHEEEWDDTAELERTIQFIMHGLNNK